MQLPFNEKLSLSEDWGGGKKPRNGLNSSGFFDRIVVLSKEGGGRASQDYEGHMGSTLNRFMLRFAYWAASDHCGGHVHGAIKACFLLF
jgi:hypothetical protein